MVYDRFNLKALKFLLTGLSILQSLHDGATSASMLQIQDL